MALGIWLGYGSRSPFSVREVLEMVAGKETAQSPGGVAVLSGKTLLMWRQSLTEQQGSAGIIKAQVLEPHR